MASRDEGDYPATGGKGWGRGGVGVAKLPPPSLILYKSKSNMAFLRGSSIYCIRKEEMDVPRRVVFSSVCITTATISSFGAIVQLLNWYKRLRAKEPRRIPSPTPHIVFSLALADLFACVGK